MAITALPTPPSSSSPSTFDTRADAFLGALPTFVTEANALQTDVNTKQSTASTAATTATTQATTATSQAALAAASAAAAAASASATLWVSGTNYTAGAVVYSPTNYATYRTTTSGTSSTDPAADTTGRWVSAMLPSVEALGWPDTRPSLLLDFVNSGAVDPRLVVSRAGDKTVRNAAGRLVTVPAHSAAVDHHPGTRVARGLRIEPARTNLLTYSGALDNAAWGKANTSISANSATGPDGTTSADTVTASAGAGSHYVSNSASVSAVAYTLTAYLKPGTCAYVAIGDRGDAVDHVATLTWADLSIVAANGTAEVDSTPDAEGFYEMRFTFTRTNATTAQCYVSLANAASNSGTPSFTATGSETVVVGGVQLEEGNTGTSYIPTTSAAVARPADNISLSLSTWADLYARGGGTLLVGFAPAKTVAASDDTQCVVSLGTSGASVWHSVFTYGTPSVLVQLYDGSSALFSDAQAGTYAARVEQVVGVSWAQDDHDAAVNGTPGTHDSAGAPLVATTLRLGCAGAGEFYRFNGWITFVALYPAKLSRAQLAVATYRG